jgi:hypothetical protein
MGARGASYKVAWLHVTRSVGFLVAAKRRTYAAQGDEATVAALLPGSEQLEPTPAPCTPS